MLSQSVPRALLSPHLCLEGVMHTSGAAASPGAPLASWQLLLRCPELNKLSQVCTNTTWKLSAEWQFLLTLLQGSPYLLEQLLDFFFSLINKFVSVKCSETAMVQWPMSTSWHPASPSNDFFYLVLEAREGLSQNYRIFSCLPQGDEALATSFISCKMRNINARAAAD